MNEEAISTIQKALAINLDVCKYGTIAEIGAGQEVARFFFKAGAAAGTVAKTISAYDMQVSDSIYGEESHGRYVSRSRVEKMLHTEFEQVVDHLGEVRPKNSTFFAFADSVAARGFRKRGECHGWLGVEVQLYPGAPPSRVIVHVRMLDTTTMAQQEALGILGVNLIYGAYYHYREPTALIDSLVDNVGAQRIEVDMVDLSGPYFDEVDNRLMALHLVESGLTHAVMFNNEGVVLQSAEALYKKNVLVARGSFRPPTVVNVDMIDSAKTHFLAEEDVDPAKTIFLAEITMASLRTGGKLDIADFLARVDLLAALGYTVLISNYLRFFRLRSYINRYTHKRIGIVVGIHNVRDIFNEDFYAGMEGGMLEAFGKLFAGNVRLYVYPQLDGRKQSRELMSLDQVRLSDQQQHFLEYLKANEYLVPIEVTDMEHLHYHSGDILRDLKKGDGDWQQGLPDSVYQTISEQRLFGYNSE